MVKPNLDSVNEYTDEGMEEGGVLSTFVTFPILGKEPIDILSKQPEKQVT